MKIIICDDNKIFGYQLTNQIKSIISQSTYADKEFIFQYFPEPKSLLDYLQNNSVDILFLDISMPEINGFEIAQQCQEYWPDICLIFISNYENQVYYSIRFSPFRFLCKSSYEAYLPEALLAAIDKLSKNEKYIDISNYNNCTPVKVSHIVYIIKEKESNYLSIHCKNIIHRYRTTIHRLEADLHDYGFIKVNSGTLINMKYISQIQDNIIELTTGEKLTVSRQCRPLFIGEYVKYMRMR